MHTIIQADAVEFLRAQPEGSLDLVFGSPPYEEARLYLEGGHNLGISRKTDAWVKWLVEWWGAAQGACKGLVALVVAGQTRNYRWSAGPVLLMAELHRAGFNLRNPPLYHRVGIPGSGGPDWLRSDYEWVICTSRSGKLPWSDNTACGHAPKWAPGGEMSHRLSDGTRRNQWGRNATTTDRKPDGSMVPEGDSGGELVTNADPWGKRGRGNNLGGRNADGSKKLGTGKGVKRGATSGYKDGDTLNEGEYEPPVEANPGNLIHCKAGGNNMGSRLAHDNEAPFPERLAEFFVLSFAPPGGLVCDPFSGSGTTATVCKRHGRNFTGCDIRESQVLLSRKRVAQETPPLFV